MEFVSNHVQKTQESRSSIEEENLQYMYLIPLVWFSQSDLLFAFYLFHDEPCYRVRWRGLRFASLVISSGLRSLLPTTKWSLLCCSSCWLRRNCCDGARFLNESTFSDFCGIIKIESLRFALQTATLCVAQTNGRELTCISVNVRLAI
jgi:hypothetical protein